MGSLWIGAVTCLNAGYCFWQLDICAQDEVMASVGY
jgi:hypothetical protein